MMETHNIDERQAKGGRVQAVVSPPVAGITPYYQDGQVTIYHGDCREILPSLAKDSVHLLLTDPPYGINYKATGHRTKRLPTHGMANDNGEINVLEILGAALRVLKGARHLYVFGKYDLTALKDIGGITELIWDKKLTGMGNVENVWSPSHEIINFGVNTKRLALVKRGSGNVAGRLRRGSVLQYQRLHASGIALHPTEKPILLLRELIESSSHIGETVLDIFAGSGSTLYAAMLEGRKAIGIEIEEKYCEIAAKRFQKHPLFSEAG